MSLSRPLLSGRNAVLHSVLTRRTLSSAPQATATEETEKCNGMKPIRLLFQGVEGFRERTDTSESDNECEKIKLEKELGEYERKLRNLIMKQTVRKRKKPEKAKSLSELFGKKKEDENNGKKMVERRVERNDFEELPMNVKLFVKYLYSRGYLKNVNLFRNNELDFRYFDNKNARKYITHAAVELGRAHQGLAKWLSGSLLEKVAMFGCPSTDKREVFAAKRLRKLFEVEENTVCSTCMLKDLCRFKNQSVSKNVEKKLSLEHVMRVAIVYAVDLVSMDLTVPDEIKQSAALVLEETIRLTMPDEIKQSAALLPKEIEDEKEGKKIVEHRVKKDDFEELPMNVKLFVKHLYNKGYFKNANFFQNNELVFHYFDKNYSREYIKHAAVELGRANQDIAELLSGSLLEKVAMFGCPSTDKREVFAAKRLRKFFEVEENTVCSTCMLKDLCRFKNQRVSKNGEKKLSLEHVMRVAIVYAVDLVSMDLTVPDEIKQSAALVLEETIRLTMPDEIKQSAALLPKEIEDEKEGKKIVEHRVKKDDFEELPMNVVLFVKYLYNRGYFKNANFFRNNELDFRYFDKNYAREYIKHAAVELGRSNQDIAEWLSGSLVEKVALFGCPSATKRDVYAAKRLRKVLKVEESTVCSTCRLKDSCRFKNLEVLKKVEKELRLEHVMRVTIAYAVDLVSTDLTVPDEIKQSAALLLKETMKLTMAGEIKPAPALLWKGTDKLTMLDEMKQSAALLLKDTNKLTMPDEIKQSAALLPKETNKPTMPDEIKQSAAMLLETIKLIEDIT